MKLKLCYMQLGVVLSVLGTSIVHAKDIFTAELQVGNSTQTIAYHNISDVSDQFDDARMRQLFPNYTDTSAVNGKVNLRDVPVNLSYAQDSSTLVFKIPSLGIERTEPYRVCRRLFI